MMNLGFIGSIILQQYRGENGENPAKVIDGQQRITTFSLFLLALYMNVPEKDKNGCKTEVQQILFSHRMTDYQYVPRLELGYLDKESYNSILDYEKYFKNDNDINIDLSIVEEKDNVKRCYDYFDKKLKEEDSAKKVDLLKKLVMNDNLEFYVGIIIDENDDEQLVFDTLNTTGKQLTNADTIKNYLYEKEVKMLIKENNNNNMKTIYNEVEKKYKQTWYETFEKDDKNNENLDEKWNKEIRAGISVKRPYIDMFLQAYASIIGIFNQKNNLEDLVKVYKAKINTLNTKAEIENFIDDICNYAKKYKEYFMQDIAEKEFIYNRENKGIIDRILLINTVTFYPYILYLLLNYNGDELADELHKVEKYLYLDLIYKINPNSDKNYNRLALQFLEKKKASMSSNDSETIEGKIKEIEDKISIGAQPYGIQYINNGLAKRLLFIIELYRSYERYNSDKHNEAYDFPEDSQLEHIMPIKWRNNWKDELCHYTDNGEELKSYEERAAYRDLKARWLGNMTILKSKLNSSISDSQMFVKMYGLNKTKHDIKKSVSENADYNITTKDVIKYYSDELLKTNFGKEIDNIKNNIISKQEIEEEISQEEWQLLGEKCEELKVKDNIWNEARITERTEKLLKELKQAVLY